MQRYKGPKGFMGLIITRIGGDVSLKIEYILKELGGCKKWQKKHYQ